MTELEVITAAAKVLKGHGDVKIEYITAEFSPSSGRFRPDLVFVPDVMPDCAVFVEFKSMRSGIEGDDLLSRLIEHRDFLSAAPVDLRVVYAFATDSRLGSGVIQRLQGHGFEFFGPVESGAALAHAVLDWVKRASLSGATR